jgi:hypothetical protein
MIGCSTQYQDGPTNSERRKQNDRAGQKVRERASEFLQNIWYPVVDDIHAVADPAKELDRAQA